ncbi:hypothetical protein A2797_01880 [candidate division WWE3 bacterium RIFCSPHIGHO2_01_FULL_48_15]|uniref:Trigger factor n=1 Tax=candidate division WWE3 bacterium RIFCSPHIGHO2_01_FULL_48_15 TaxID=1802619 RepID=A0A1F4VG39_UNCKA|nr:MAG: hypothetical protein A2797_01880 [candidate division WWE3 bacterium RIFCSPHIGHO2_01_FULL_48_15]
MEKPDSQSDLKREDGTIVLTITIPSVQVKETFERIKKAALKEVKVPGFRPGKAPSDLAEKQLNEEALSQSLFQELVPIAYASAVTEKGIKPIISPQITIKSFKPPTRVGVPTEASGKDEDLVIEAKTAERPPVNLGDYKSELKRGFARFAVGEPSKKVLYGPEGKPLEGGEKVTAAAVLEKLRETSQVDVPHILIDFEVQRMLSSLIDQVRGLGLTIDQYLSSQGKKAEELRKEYHSIAQRNLKDEFILSEISVKEGVKVSEKEIEEAIEAAPDEKTRAGLSEERGKNYLEDVLRKRKTIEHLIKLAGES